MSDPVVITVDPDKPIREQIDTPENRSAIEDVVRASLGIEGGTGEAHAPDGSLWAEMASDAQVPPITFTTARKDLHAALSRTQHALAPDEPDSRPVLTCWWLSVTDQKLTIHTADNYRVARSRIAGTPPDWTAITEGALPAIIAGYNARYIAEAAKAAEAGASGVVRWEYIDERRPLVFRSSDLDEWIMPVRLGTPEP